MKNLIKEVSKELTTRIENEDYKLFSLEVGSNSYFATAKFSIDEIDFHFSVAENYVCDHSEFKILTLEDERKVSKHFKKKFDEKFNSEEVKAERIKKLEAEIKSLKSLKS